MSFIKNAADTPLNEQGQGTIPNVNAALTNWMQPMVFGIVTKTTSGFEVVETMHEIEFQGVIQPLTGRRLMLKPEGQRAWTWFWLHADPGLNLQVDSVVIYRGKQTRVMAKKNYTIYGYVEYELVQDWTGAGPGIEPAPTTDWDGGAPDTDFENELDGGAPDTVYTETIDGGTP